MNRILLISFVILLSFLSVQKSLSFALNGDDWLALYRFLIDFTNFNSYFDIRHYSNDYSNYVFADIMMGWISKVFAYNPFPYYFISLVCRIIAALSFYLAVSGATKNKYAGYLSSLFFATMFAGIETTNWVFNLNTYISLTLLNLFIFLYFRKDHKVFSPTTLILSLILAATFFTAPTRMHGLIFIIPLVILAKFKYLNFSSIKKLFFESLFFYIPIILIRIFASPKSDKDHLDIYFQVFSHNLVVVTNLLATIGNSLIPDRTFSFFVGENSLAAFFTCILYITLFSVFYISRRKFPELSRFGAFSLTVPLSFSIIPWLINPIVVLSSDHRYQLIVGSFLLVSLSTVFAILLQQRNQFLKSIGILAPIAIILINLFTLNEYFDFLSKEGRLASDAEKHFTYLKSQIQKPNNDAPVVFLFFPDNPFYLYNAITFGLTYHWIVIDSRFELDDSKAPFPADSLDSLLLVLKDPYGTERLRFGYKGVHIPIDNVYSFKLEDKQLTNITPQIRELLRENLPSYKEQH